MIGKRINGRYQLLETIGGGGMANVYKAHDAILNRTVAVKVLRPQFSDDDEFIRRFHREAQAATSLFHPNVVNIYDVGEENSLYYIVMEFVEGLTLKQLIQQRGALPIEETVNIMLQISAAIAHAHDNHIVHRDIKPHNILISDEGEAKVTDFGIARAMTSATITHTNSVMGSVHYLSPEQARGGMVNEKSDIYSLGIVLYEMVTGSVPFSGDTAVSIAIKHLQTEVPSPRKVNSNLPQSIENIILKATAKDPFHRYSKVSEMEDDLHTALDPSRFNEKKFVVPHDSDDVTKAIPIIKENHFVNQAMDETKVVKFEDDDKKPIKQEKKSKKWLTITLIAFLLVIGSVAAAFSIVPKLLHVDEVTIPEDLIGMEYDEAFEKLTTLGLNVEKDTVTHQEIAEGHIVSHNPDALRTVKVGSSITLNVSEGKEKIMMDNVTNKHKDLAKRNLIALGFKESNIKMSPESTDDFEENTVISQIPVAGEMIVPEDTIVFITYSEPEEVILENLQNFTYEEVNDYIIQHKLSGDISETVYSDTIPEGKVIEQYPPMGTRVKKGDEIKVVFSRGPEPEPEPEPISTLIPIELPVSEADQLAAQIYFYRITYQDSTIAEPKVFDERAVSQTEKIEVPVTINPGEEAQIIVYIKEDDEWKEFFLLRRSFDDIEDQ